MIFPKIVDKNDCFSKYMKYFQLKAGIVPNQQGNLHTRRTKVSTFNVGKHINEKLLFTDISIQIKHEC